MPEKSPNYLFLAKKMAEGGVWVRERQESSHYSFVGHHFRKVRIT
jgi:hypothetical protein